MKTPIKHAEEPTHVDKVATPFKMDPDNVDISDTIKILVEATQAADIGDSRLERGIKDPL